MKKLLFAVFCAISAFAYSQIVPKGTQIKAALDEELRGGSVTVGQPVHLILAEDVIINGNVAIPKGKKVVGTINEARSSGVLGRKGKLGFSMDYLYLNDSKVVKLSSQNNTNLKGSGVIVGVATAINPLGLLIPGKGAKYEKGKVFTAYIDQDVNVSE